MVDIYSYSKHIGWFYVNIYLRMSLVAFLNAYQCMKFSSLMLAMLYYLYTETKYCVLIVHV